MDEITIGARLRTLRRWRGMTQVQLADMAGVSDSFVSMVEHGTRMLDRRSHISALAAALRVSETDLVGGPHLSSDRLQSDPHMAIPPLRVALQTNSLTRPAVDQARPLTELHKVVFGTIEPLRRVCDYVAVGQLLPDCIDELYRHAAEPADQAAHQLALETLVEACVIASAVSKELNYLDLAYLAAQRAEEASAVLGDPVQKGKADFMWLLTLPRAGSWDRNLAAAEQAASELEPHARDPLGRQVLGMLTLTASLSAASIQRGDRAAHWLSEAEKIGARVPDEPMRTWQCFSTTNVHIWRISVGVERERAAARYRSWPETSISVCWSRRHRAGQAISLMSGAGLPESLAPEPKQCTGSAVPRTRRRSECGTHRLSGIQWPTCSTARRLPLAAGNSGEWRPAWDCRTDQDV